MKIAGLDIGITGCKCTVFDEQGHFLDKAYRDYPVKRTVGSHEADVSSIMEGVYEVLRELTKSIRILPASELPASEKPSSVWMMRESPCIQPCSTQIPGEAKRYRR